MLQQGVIEGRKIFANITKYIKMGASSNFGNMFSVLGASLFLPFLPMAPIQVLTNNLLYDFSQTTIPTDNVDEEYIAAPRRWDISNIFKFMVFIGPISSIFDYATYAMMLFVFDAGPMLRCFRPDGLWNRCSPKRSSSTSSARRRIPFIESRASAALIATTIIICIVELRCRSPGQAPRSALRRYPALYWPLVAAMLVSYATLTHLTKIWFVRRWGM